VGRISVLLASTQIKTIMKYLVKVLALNAGKTIYRSGDVVSGGVFGTERLAELLKGGYISEVSAESADVVEEVADVVAEVETDVVTEEVAEVVSEAAAEVPAAEEKPKAKKAAEKKTENTEVNLGDVNLL